MKKYNAKYLVGDIHGYWSVILNHLYDLNFGNAEGVCYIQVGDFLVGFGDSGEFKKLLMLNDALKKKNSDLYVIRGNHDNPNWFIDSNFIDLKNQLTNIKFIQDYTVLSIDSENFLFVGGAISIDRELTKKNDAKNGVVSWWNDEVINFDFEKLKEFRNIDRVVCHSAPDFCEPLKFNQLVYDFAKNDNLLLDDLRDERKKITLMVTELSKNNNLLGYYYGHFHRNYRFYHNNCEFVGIGVDQFFSL